MSNPLTALDWSRIPVFLAVAETGSLSAAARKLNQSQPTLGRQIKAMEEELGVALFTRQARGLVLTETGADLLGPAQAMLAEANRLTLAAAGREQSLAGTVRLTASEVVSLHLMPPIIAKMRQAEPDIQIELAPSDDSHNLLFREADIALRMYQPEQLDMIARHVGDYPLAAFCSRDYVARHGMPANIEAALTHGLVGFDRNDRLIRGLRKAGLNVDRNSFAIRCDSQVVNWQLVRAGCGIGFYPLAVGMADPTMVRVLPEAPIPVLPVWLATHEAMRRTPRIRRIWDILVAELTTVLAPRSSVAATRQEGDTAPYLDAGE